MSPHLPVTPARDRGRRRGRSRSRAPRSSTCTRATRSTAGRRRIPKYFREFAPDDRASAATWCSQLHDRRRGDDVDRGAAAAGAAAQARGRVAQHGVDELRALPDAEALHPLRASTGSASTWQASEERIFRNTFKDIAYILTSCAENGTRFEIECYDIGHLYTAAHFLERGLVKPPLFIQSVFGILGGIGAASRTTSRT